MGQNQDLVTLDDSVESMCDRDHRALRKLFLN